MLIETATPIWPARRAGQHRRHNQSGGEQVANLERRDMVISPCTGARKRQHLPVCPDYKGVFIKTQNCEIGCTLKFKVPRVRRDTRK